MNKFLQRISVVLLICFVFTLIPQNYVKAKAETRNTTQTQLTGERKLKERKIVKEIEEKREENVKYFLMDDFSYEMAVYNEPVHYLDNGKWVDIDNSLSESEDIELKKIDKAKDDIKNKESKKDNTGIIQANNELNDKNILSINKNNFNINLAKNADSQKLVNISKDKYKLSWGLEGANKVVANSAKKDEKKIQKDIEASVDIKIKNSKKTVDEEDRAILIQNENKKNLPNISAGVKYNNIFENIDLEYNLASDTIKENIIINKKDNNNILEYIFNIETGNLIAKQGEDKKIYFYDKDDLAKVIFVLDSPFMYDANYSQSNKIDLILSDSKNGYTVKMIPNKEWINSNDRVYPITIDPIIKTSQDRSKIIDTFTRGVDTENKYNNMFLRVGNNSGEVCRSYINFDIPTLTSAETVVGATLALELSDAQGATNQVNVHKITSSWMADASHNLSTSTKPTFNSVISD